MKHSHKDCSVFNIHFNHGLHSLTQQTRFNVKHNTSREVLQNLFAMYFLIVIVSFLTCVTIMIHYF